MTDATMPTARPAASREDGMTIAAVAVIVYALSSVLHEGVGHGGACLAVDGVAQSVSSMTFECALPGLEGSAAHRIVAAGGTVATLAGGLAALGIYRRTTSADAPAWRYALWLFAAVNLMQGTGYFLFSGVGGIGDWAVVIDGLTPAWAWRAGLAVAGGLLYSVTTRLMLRELAPFIGDGRPERYRRALWFATLAYVVGGVLEIGAGLANPGGLLLVAISGAAASLGGTSGLAFGPQYLRGAPVAAAADRPAPLGLGRHPLLVAVAALLAAVFVAVLGHGVRLG